MITVHRELVAQELMAEMDKRNEEASSRKL